MPRKINEHLIPLRRWTATVTTTENRKYTTTIYGRNVTQAELDYAKANPGTRNVIARLEQRD